ncbi:MAG: MmcQ/YjbR family DNA-binding protein, partial [Acidobacteriota bacterium]
GAEEGSHMGHADFRVKGKIFASLNADETEAMAKLTPDQQADFITRYPDIFRPASGKWGTGGATMIILAQATEDPTAEALTLAHQNLTARPAAPSC